MLTFESLISVDPLAGGFAERGGAGNGTQGAPATGAFATQLSGVMAGPTEAQAGAAAPTGVKAAGTATGGITGILQLTEGTDALAAGGGIVIQATGGIPVAAGMAEDEFGASLIAGVSEIEAGLEAVVSDGQSGASIGDGDAVLEAEMTALAAGLGAPAPQTAPVAPVPSADGDAAQSDGDAAVDPLTAAGGKPGAPAQDLADAMAKAGTVADKTTTGPVSGAGISGVAAGQPASGATGATPTQSGFDTLLQQVAGNANGSAAATDVEGADQDVLTEVLAQTVAGKSGKSGDATATQPGQPVATAGGNAAAASLAARAGDAVTQPSGTAVAAGAGSVSETPGDSAATDGDQIILSVKATRTPQQTNAPAETAAQTAVAKAGEAQMAAVAKPGTQTQAEAAVAAADDVAESSDDSADRRPVTSTPAPNTTLSKAAPASMDPNAAAAVAKAQGGEADPKLANLSSVSGSADDGDAMVQDDDGADPRPQTADRTNQHLAAPAPRAAAAPVVPLVAAQKAIDPAAKGDDGGDTLILGSSVDASGAAAARAGDAQAARAVQAGQTSSSALPTAMVASEMARQAQRGVTRFEIRLDPPELGRVDVHLKINDDGKVQAHLVVERRDTLDMFMRDQRGMERALENAGLKTNADGGLQFSLKDQGQRFADQGGNGQAQQGGLNGRAAGAEAAEQPQQLERIAAYSRNGASGVDIRV